jgi:outer membrane biogenesis lipoprotein LolB
MMKRIAVVAILLLTGCAAAIKLPGTKDPQTEQIKALVDAIQKQSDALVAVATKASPSPTPEVK